MGYFSYNMKITDTMKAEEKFEQLKERYVLAFLSANGRLPYCVLYKNGFVCIYNDEQSSIPTKVRVSEFEKMAERLEERTRKEEPEPEPMWKIELAKVEQVPQTQEPLSSQLQKLRVIANKFGLYDAADFIRYNILKQK